MPNLIDSSGLQTKTLTELTDDLTAAFKIIYGNDINVDSDSPDGQLINIFSQAVIDNLDLLVQIYNGFNPDAAIGRTLDQRVAINGIQRLGGTFTLTPITVVTDRAVTLTGLDTDIDNPDGTGYTVADANGNKFILTATTNITGAGSHVLSFRAQNSGEVTTTLNTITVPITIQLGVVSVNNPSAATYVGINEETDAELRLRRQKSVALASQGFLAGLQAALLNVSGVTYARVYENNTGSTDSDGIPSHSIWCIVDGGDSLDIATQIYNKRNAGCGMKGSTSYTITQVDGTPFVIYWDSTSTEALWIQFSATSINGIDPVNTTELKSYIINNLSLGVYETVNVNEIAALVQSYDSNTLATSIGLAAASGGPFLNVLTNSAKNKQFTLAASQINITVV